MFYVRSLFLLFVCFLLFCFLLFVFLAFCFSFRNWVSLYHRVSMLFKFFFLSLSLSLSLCLSLSLYVSMSLSLSLSVSMSLRINVKVQTEWINDLNSINIMFLQTLYLVVEFFKCLLIRRIRVSDGFYKVEYFFIKKSLKIN